MFIIFILVFTVSIWNIVTSVFVEKALKLAEPDLDAIVVERLGSKTGDAIAGRRVSQGEIPAKKKAAGKNSNGKSENMMFGPFLMVPLMFVGMDFWWVGMCCDVPIPSFKKFQTFFLHSFRCSRYCETKTDLNPFIVVKYF